MRAGWTWGWQFDGACRGDDSSLFFAPSYFEKREEKVAFGRSGKDVYASKAGEPGAAKIDATTIDNIVKALEELK